MRVSRADSSAMRPASWVVSECGRAAGLASSRAVAPITLSGLRKSCTMVAARVPIAARRSASTAACWAARKLARISSNASFFSSSSAFFPARAETSALLSRPSRTRSSTPSIVMRSCSGEQGFWR